MTPDDHQAAASAWQHAHPVLMIAFSVAGTVIVITLVVIIRWLSNFKAWPYHPRGGVGFLLDEFVRWGAILIPYLTLGIAFRYYVYGLHPELNKPQTWMIFIVCAIIFRMVLRRLPFVKSMARHIDAAKAQYRTERLEGRAK